MLLNKERILAEKECIERESCEGCPRNDSLTCLANITPDLIETALHYMSECEELRKNELEWIGVNNKQGAMLMQQAKVLRQAKDTLEVGFGDLKKAIGVCRTTTGMIQLFERTLTAIDEVTK